MTDAVDRAFLRVEEKLAGADLETLKERIESISFEAMFDHVQVLNRTDWIMIGVAGVAGALIDIIYGRPTGFSEPEIKDNSLFGLGEQLKNFDPQNNPIDFQADGPVGDRRLYSYGHDLFRFFEGVKEIMNGVYQGISPDGHGVITHAFAGYSPVNLHTAIITLILHLFKDFWTSMSLPLPGMTWLANLNGDQMPEFAKKLYEDGVNLRTVTAEISATVIVELTIRVYHHFRFREKSVSQRHIEAHRDRMLACAHGVALLANIGKVAFTQQPKLLNIGQWAMFARAAIRLWRYHVTEIVGEKMRVSKERTNVMSEALASLLIDGRGKKALYDATLLLQDRSTDNARLARSAKSVAEYMSFHTNHMRAGYEELLALR
ncbi:hypothetical protein [Kyrpidia sp.]|uniref:hypothetical protein n=1 Tax=Kyrpidia sp. TaxID=2073077 RepID=UPI00258BCF86|nr:hypothetical protein [Kyrpidia sp.]MCL6576907.1 hypothetical protein [Kyrpidia sp.]